jgi:hypothetical protein
MDQRHGVDHLDGASGGHGNGLGSTDELAGGDAEHGAYTLAAGEEGVAHGLVDLTGVLERNGGVEGLVDGIGLLEHVGLKIESGSWL